MHGDDAWCAVVSKFQRPRTIHPGAHHGGESVSGHQSHARRLGSGRARKFGTQALEQLLAHKRDDRANLRHGRCACSQGAGAVDHSSTEPVSLIRCTDQG